MVEQRTKIVKSNAKSKQIQDVISIDKVNDILGTNFRIFYSTKWLNENEILLSNGQSYYIIDVTNKSCKKNIIYDEKNTYSEIFSKI